LTITAQTSTPKAFSFYRLLPDGRFEFFVDASLLKSFSHCERYFYLKHVKNLRAKGYGVTMPFPMAIGSWWSDVMEMFYNFLRDKKEVGSTDIQNFALKAWHDCNLDACALADPDKFETFGDLAGAVLMLQEYYNSQYLVDKHNWKVVAVEEGFGLNKEVLLGETRSVVVYWVGKPDLVVAENGRLTPVDHKTVSRIDGLTISRYKPSTQMPGYVHSCEVIARQLGYDVRVDRCVVNICSRTRPSDNPRSGKRRPRFIRAYPNFSREEIAEWKKDVIAKCERIATCLKTNTWTWSETTCHNMYMRQCDYIKLDSSTPSSRDIILMADFLEGQPWVPYQPQTKEVDD
jgi:PD-(D/E)XK nuclease superfamily